MSATKHIAQNAPWHRAATTLSVLLLVLGPWCAVTAGSAAANPPFSGTIFIDPDIVTASDLTTYQSAVSAGQGYRWMYDRRVNNWVYLNAYLVNASFDDGLSIEIQVNPEFGSAAEALAQAQTYAPAIGQLSTALRRDVQTCLLYTSPSPRD